MRNVWFLRGWRKYFTAVLLVADLGLGGFSTAMALSGGNAVSNSSPISTPSSVTTNWTTDRHTYDSDYTSPTSLDPHDNNQASFTNLQVSVSQTKDLTDQGVLVSWKGGTPTGSSGASGNYMQIMQCWASKGASGPTPQQCQWGMPNPTIAGQMGLSAASRNLLKGAQADRKQFPNGLCTPEFEHAQIGQVRPGCNVPFWSINDPKKASLGWTNDQYNLPPYGIAQSNEVSYARTAADGTGQYIFNLQSALSAPYLGCGNPQYTTAGNTCWLVVVPRGEYNLNGDLALHETTDSGYGSNYNYVAGSPLSASAWQNRVQFKMQFSPIGASCSLGAAAVRTSGSELISRAFGSWQSTLCSQGTTMGYSEISDGQARSALTSGGSAMSFVGNLPDPSTTTGQTIASAPVANSAIVVSYLIDKNYIQDPSNPDIGANGTLVNDLRLTPLIVAKLLTQSYRQDTPGDGKGVGHSVPATNPDSLLQDTDFLKLNPDFKYFYPGQIPDGLIVPFGDSDAAKAVWTWLRSDAQAKSFLEGNEVDGAKINTAYAGLHLGTDATITAFPKSDTSTFRTGDWPAPGFGTLDMRPFAADFADGAHKTVTANAGVKTIWDSTLNPPQATSVGSQVPGTRFEMAITTSQAAALYGLPTAALVGSPDDTTPGVSATTATISSGSYPLTMSTYAAVNVCTTSLSDLSADAKFLSYAAGAGQAPGTRLGQLPPGYAPLSSADRAKAISMVGALRAEVASPQCASHKKLPPIPGGQGGTGSTNTGGSTGGTTTPTTSTTTPGGTTTPSGGAPKITSDAAPGGITPTAYVTPTAQYALLAALCFFVPCVIAGPTLLLAARNKS